MKHTLDVIITTYKRPESLHVLVKQILQFSTQVSNIIIVDSSPEENRDIQTLDKVQYMRSSHGNQPYQRYLGYLSSKSDILIYFDDDMRFLDEQAIDKILCCFDEKNVIAVQPNFVNKNEFLDHTAPQSSFNALKRYKNIFHLFKCLTGYCIPAPGKFSYCGIRGPKPDDLGSVECFNGGVFAVKREVLYENFNFRLFDMFEERIGMGEDAILGYGVAQQGKIVYLAGGMFLHDDQQDSTYTVDFYSYGFRVIYSRLYLSLEYVRLSNKTNGFALMHYHWYVMWRLIGMALNQLKGFKKSRKEMMIGYIRGWRRAVKDYRVLQDNSQLYWSEEALRDR